MVVVVVVLMHCWIIVAWLRIDIDVSQFFHNSYHEKDRSNELPTNSPVDSWAKTRHRFDILTEAIDACFISETKYS